MAHILWIILKVILIILAVILGLVLLMVLLLLFCPVRYKVQGSKTEEQSFKEASGQVRISWLFGGASVTADYAAQKPVLSMRLFGIPLDRFLSKEDKPQEAVEAPEQPAELPVTSAALPEDEKQSAKEPESEKSEQSVSAETTPEETVPQAEEPEETAIQAKEPEETDLQTEGPEQPEETEDELPETVKQKKPGLFGRIKAGLAAIKQKISSVLESIRKALTEIGWWKDFFFHERTQAALALVFREARFLIRHVLPTRMKGEISFGFEDPSVTGRITAALAMTIPFHKNKIICHPSFECRSFFEGNVTLKGRIYGAAFVLAGLKIILSRNIRFVLKTIKRKKNRKNHAHKEE